MFRLLFIFCEIKFRKARLFITCDQNGETFKKKSLTRSSNSRRDRGRIEPEPDEFLSLEEEANFIWAGDDGSNSDEEESGGENSEESESEGIPDRVFIGAKDEFEKFPPGIASFTRN